MARTESDTDAQENRSRPQPGFSGGTALYAGGAIAQQQPSRELQRPTVTGSSIKRTDVETASPVQTITRDDIEKSGKTSIAEVILSLNGINQGSVPLSFGRGLAAGASGVSMHRHQPPPALQPR